MERPYTLSEKDLEIAILEDLVKKAARAPRSVVWSPMFGFNAATGRPLWVGWPGWPEPRMMLGEPVNSGRPPHPVRRALVDRGEVLALMRFVITLANFRVIGLELDGSSGHGDPSAPRAGIQVSRTAEDHSLRQTRMIIGPVPGSDRG